MGVLKYGLHQDCKSLNELYSINKDVTRNGLDVNIKAKEARFKSERNKVKPLMD